MTTPTPKHDDERMTGAQASYLKTLCEEARETFDPHLGRAEASRRIDELQKIIGRGIPVDDVDDAPPPGA